MHPEALQMRDDLVFIAQLRCYVHMNAIESLFGCWSVLTLWHIVGGRNRYDRPRESLDSMVPRFQGSEFHLLNWASVSQKTHEWENIGLYQFITFLSSFCLYIYSSTPPTWLILNIYGDWIWPIKAFKVCEEGKLFENNMEAKKD